MECVDGRCKNTDGSCPGGFEGNECNIRSNEKFEGKYDVDYYGTGNLSSTEGKTVANVKLVPQTPNKIRIDVKLILTASLLGQVSEIPLTISVEADVQDNKYHVASTRIQTTVDVQGFPLPVDFTYEVNGIKGSEKQLNSVLTLKGTLSGTVIMTGEKK